MKIELAEIKKLFETQSVELKKSLSLQKEAFESLCAMINTDYARGKVLFGISPDLDICGIEPGNLDSAQKSLVENLRHKFDPPIIADIELLEYNNVRLLLLQAERSMGVAYHEYDGRAFIREGSSNRQLSYEEKQQISRKRNRDRYNGPWKCDRCGSIVGMLSSLELTESGIRKTYNCSCGGEYWPL